MDVCGFSVLETVWQRRKALAPVRARELLGGGSSPLFLVFLEHLLDSSCSCSEEVAVLLAEGYVARCAREAQSVPAEWSAMVDQFAGLRLFDLAEAPLEIRWALRHWRSPTRTARSMWLDSLAPRTLPNAARAQFYVIKLQTLLVDLKRFAPDTVSRVCSLLEHECGQLDLPWVTWCRFLWLPGVGRLDESLVFASSHLAPEGAAGFCGEFCSSAAEWKMALERTATKPQLQAMLLMQCADIFGVRELVLHVLPEEGAVTAHLATIWKAQKLSLLPTILAFSKQ